MQLKMYTTKLFNIHSYLIIIFLLLFSQLSSANEAGTGNERGEILFISSYNSDSQFIYDNINSFIEEYKALGGACQPVVENMNCTSLRYSSVWMETMLTILHKHPQAKLIILLGAEAWATYFSTCNEKYYKIPVFCGMSHRYAAPLDEVTDISQSESSETTDFLEKMKGFNVLDTYIYNYDVDKDIQLIRSFYPDVKNIALVTDNTYNGASHLRQVKNAMKHYKDLRLICVDGRKEGIDSARDILRHLPVNTVMLLGIWRIDKDDVIYMNNAVYAMKSANPELPVFSLTATGIGYWAIGGYVPKYYSIGPQMAARAYQLIDQNKPGKPLFHINRNEYTFDTQKLTELGFSDKKLPEGSVLVNKKKTFYELYQWQIITVTLFFLVLITGFVTTFYYYIRVRNLKNNLENSEHQLRLEKEFLEESEQELRIAKERAEEANRTKSAFVSNMSHEIRTPLNAIVGFSNVLVSETQDNEELKEYAGIIHHNSDLLLRLINDILDISRIESGKMQLNLEPCDVIPHFRSVLKSMEHNKASGVELLFDSPSKELYITTDIVRLQQIVINLLSNAMKFTKKGFIELAVCKDKADNRILFSVTDTGCGIPEDKQGKVFERFEKLNEFVQGTGLGLSICRLIIEKLGGEIWVDGDYKQGARFVFFHPIEPCPKKA